MTMGELLNTKSFLLNFELLSYISNLTGRRSHLLSVYILTLLDEACKLNRGDPLLVFQHIPQSHFTVHKQDKRSALSAKLKIF